MNIVNIGGKSFSFKNGSNVSVSNGKVMVDGHILHAGLEPIIVEIHGDVNNIKSDNSVTVKGSVLGSVDAGNSVHCGDVGGNVEAGNSVHAKALKGNAKAGNNVRIN